MITSDIANSLVLLSLEDGMWKITDFGLASEGTSKAVHTTKYSRGTPCYRAPELVRDEPFFNRKVDIWSIGCILYELLEGSKVFGNDFEVLQYASSDDQPMPPLPSLRQQPRRAQRLWVALFNACLEKKWWTRPSTSKILQFLTLLNDDKTIPGFLQMWDDVIPIEDILAHGDVVKYIPRW